MLALEHLIICSHEDFSDWSTLVAGFNDQKQLVFQLKYTNDNTPKLNHTNIAYLNQEEAFSLAQKLHVPLIELPQAFYKKFGSDSFCYPSDVEQVFSGILRYIVSQQISYHLR